MYKTIIKNNNFKGNFFQKHSWIMNLSNRLGHIAIKKGIDFKSYLIIKQVIAIMAHNITIGQICVPLKNICKQLELDTEVIIHILQQACFLGQENSILILDNTEKLYFSRYYDTECRLASGLINILNLSQLTQQVHNTILRDNNICCLTESTISICLKKILGYVKQQNPLMRDKNLIWQQISVIIAIHSRLLIINGNYGTSKITTLAIIVACLLDIFPKLNILLLAPTKRGIQYTQDKLLNIINFLPPDVAVKFPRSVFSVNYLLNQISKNQLNKNTLLPYDLIVVNDASMLDLDTMTYLVEALIPNTTRLILLGDKDQLNAVEKGTIFNELCKQSTLSNRLKNKIESILNINIGIVYQNLSSKINNRSPILQDITVHLNDNDCSPITNLALAVQDGNLTSIYTILTSISIEDMYKNYEREATYWIKINNQQTLDIKLVNAIIESYVPYLEILIEWQNILLNKTVTDKTNLTNIRNSKLSLLFKLLKNYRVICAVKYGPYGIDMINHIISSFIQSNRLLIIENVNEYFIGQAIMITHNDHVLNLFNGDIGIILNDDKGNLYVYFQDRNNTNGYRSLPVNILSKTDTAFAMTIYNSQNLVFDTVCLLLPLQLTNNINRELIYTGITRAKHKLILISTIYVFTTAISINTQHNSGFLNKIKLGIQSK